MTRPTQSSSLPLTLPEPETIIPPDPTTLPPLTAATQTPPQLTRNQPYKPEMIEIEALGPPT
ncbi:hypothetical protein CHS0354_010631, partial [Potamilus streckersoni]